MTTNNALKKYRIYLQVIVDDHLSKMKERKTLNANDKQEIINDFFVDFDNKANVKGLEILNQFPTLGDKAVLNNQFVIIQKELNNNFKSDVMTYELTDSDNPTE